MCSICTGQIATYRGANGLDTTVKSSSTEIGRVFAPTWDMVMGAKQGRISEAEYTDLFYALIRSRYSANKELILDLLRQDRVVVLCYCKPGVFCHRHLVVDILEKIAQHHNIPFERGGEVSKE